MVDLRHVVASLAVLGAAAMALAAITASSLPIAALAIGAVALTATVCVVVLRVARQIHRMKVQLEALAVANHKRASVWNHRLTEALARGGSTRSTATQTPYVTRVGKDSSWDRHPQAELLLSSGIFDFEYYTALVDGRFDRPADAVSHYLNVNASNGVMPSPFLDGRFLPEHARTALASGDVKPLLAFLRSDEVFKAAQSAVFHAQFSGVTPDSARSHSGGALGAFLERLGDDTPLAIPPASRVAGTTAATVRRARIEHAKGVHAAASAAGPRVQSAWDDAAEMRWLADLHDVGGEPLPKVSVIMPVKDRAFVVTAAVNSVQRQTHEDWELVVVDDGSSDDTIDVVRRLAAGDSRITLISNQGTGVSAARNAGLASVTGEYVAFLDSDNVWVPHFLESMLRAMARDELEAAYAVVKMHSATGALTYRAFTGGLEHLTMLNHIDLNVLVVRRELVTDIRFDESLRRWVDHDFTIKVATLTVPRLLPFVGCEYDHSNDAADRISVRESEHWQWVALERYWAQWDAATETVRGRLSVVIPTYNDSAMTIDAVQAVLRDADAWALDVEVVIVDNGSRIEIGQEILATLGALPRVRVAWLPRNLNFAIACNVGVIKASGEFTLFLNNDTIVRHGALQQLVDSLRDPDVIGAQPLLLYADETIQTAGTVFTAADALPNHFLTGHPAADALPLADAQFDAVTAAALLMRTDQVRALRGFDAIYVNGMEDVDLCLRARREFGGHFGVVPTAIVTHLESKTPRRGVAVDENRRIFLERWSGRLPRPQEHLYRRTGFAVAHVGTDGRAIPGPKPVVIRDPGDTRTRWGIKIASVGGRSGDFWGDTHFAESLRSALEAHGQRAVVHRQAAHSTSAAGFDDVVLVIRGLERVAPMPGKFNILWIISHPNGVTREELREFDLVFAASEPWSKKASEFSDRKVRALLQATDTQRFTPTVAPVPHDGPLFVGSTHDGRQRPVVEAALSAGLPLAVYGRGWGESLPAGVLRGEYIANEELAGYYRGAARVLADHWGDMAAEGFVQNRIFDAVASGARVITDPVEGIEDLFQGAVRTYASVDELSYLCSDGGMAAFPTDERMRALAEQAAMEHSFARRAVQLIDQYESHMLEGPVREEVC